MIRTKEEFLRLECDYLKAEHARLFDELKSLDPEATYYRGNEKELPKSRSADEMAQIERLRGELANIDAAMEEKGCERPADLAQAMDELRKYEEEM